MSYIDVTGKNEEEALSRALSQLGLDRDDVSVEILERAKSGFLGIGSAPAKVRVTYGEEETAPVVEKKPAETRAAKAPAAEKSTIHQETAPKAEKVAETPRVSAQAVEKPAAPAKQPAAPAAQAPAAAEDDEKANAIRTFLTGLLAQMESKAEIRITVPENGRYRVLLVGENLGALIGRRGETLDAIQQLTSYAVNRTGGRVRVQLDAENYRQRREESLNHLAQKVAAKVVKYRRSVTLEPMNAYERHVIHTALQEIPGITTYSIGVDPNRRVIVGYDASKQ